MGCLLGGIAFEGVFEEEGVSDPDADCGFRVLEAGGDGEGEVAEL